MGTHLVWLATNTVFLVCPPFTPLWASILFQTWGSVPWRFQSIFTAPCFCLFLIIISPPQSLAEGEMVMQMQPASKEQAIWRSCSQCAPGGFWSPDRRCRWQVSLRHRDRTRDVSEYWPNISTFVSDLLSPYWQGAVTCHGPFTSWPVQKTGREQVPSPQSWVTSRSLGPGQGKGILGSAKNVFILIIKCSF